MMDFVEHDLKTLLSFMPTPFALSEVKTLLSQLLAATAHCHSNWVLHRDLKTSNLLMSNRGVLKVADFGLARRFGEPLGEMTELVVTLWYRCVLLCQSRTKPDQTVALFQMPRTAPGDQGVFDGCRHLVHRMHLWRASAGGAVVSGQRRD